MREIKEIWRDVKGYEFIYAVSNTGKVKRLPYFPFNISGLHFRREHICKQHIQNSGYYVVDLYKNNKRKTKLVHRLVAEAFIPNPNNYKCVNHINSNRTDNNVTNLEWCTHSYNAKWSYATNNRKEKMHWRRGGDNANSKSVIMKTKNNQVVKVFPSIMDAERETGILNNAICQCLKCKTKTAGGYLWEYAQ